jgi:hypothetical protein
LLYLARPSPTSKTLGAILSKTKENMKKKYYILFAFIIILLQGYYLFISTDLFVPKQKEIINSKGLFKEMLIEIAKIDKKSDTIIFIYADTFCGCGYGRNIEVSKTAYEKKIIEINHNQENPYFIDIEKSFEERYDINYKKIIVLRRCSDNRYFEKLNSKKQGSNLVKILNMETKFNLYRATYKVVNKNNIEILVNEQIKMLVTRKNGKWTATILNKNNSISSLN